MPNLSFEGHQHRANANDCASPPQTATLGITRTISVAFECQQFKHLRSSMRHLTLAIATLVLSGCELIPPVDVPPMSAEQKQAVVFDIDGTLTPRDIYVFEARPGAANAVSAIAKKGYRVVYITTRIPLYQSVLPDWLRDNGFPVGSLHVAQTSEERSDPAGFKAGILDRYKTAGWHLAYAYGDSTTDFEAYAKAGIPRGRVFALKRRFSRACADGAYESCLDGWLEHLPYIDREITRAQ